MKIRHLRNKDYMNWLPLWNMNSDNNVSDQQTNITWKKITNKKTPLFGIAIWNDTEIVGILHYTLHPISAKSNDACFMQDIFISPIHRKKGFAKELLKELFETSIKNEWSWVYWFANDDNQEAAALYKNIGLKMEMGVHMYIPGLS